MHSIITKGYSSEFQNISYVSTSKLKNHIEEKKHKIDDRIYEV